MVSILVLPCSGLDGIELVLCDNNLVIKESQFVRMLHVINVVTIDTCDIHQIKEYAEVKSKMTFDLNDMLLYAGP